MVDKEHPKNYTVHMIGNAHIDPVWLWRLKEGRKEVSDTCRSALDRMNETPDFIFSRSSAAAYLWLEEDAPEMFEEVRRRIAEGRWEVVNGWWEQPDANIPGGESYVRHALYAKEYFREKFGVDVRVGYNVDTFGHNGNLPQILAKSGFDSYVFFRPGPHEKTLPQIFWWEAPDGSRVLACRPPHHYGFGGDFGRMAERIMTAWQQTDDGLVDVLCFYGVGNHGGGPTKENIRAIIETNQREDAPNVTFSTCHAFFDKIRREKTDYPVVKDDLQHHAVGCYSVVTAMKRFNRRSEQALMAAERFATVAHTLCGQPYPGDELRDAWRDVLFSQFHDVLAGTSITPAYEDIYNMYARAIETAGTATTHALRAIARNIDTRGDGLAVVVFNPNMWRRKDAVTVGVECAVAPHMALLTDEQGNDVHAQVIAGDERGDRNTGRVMFVADVPALGYRVYRLRLDEMRDTYDAKLAPARLTFGSTTLGNDLLALEVDHATGAITSLRVAGGLELIGGQGVMFAVMNDPSDTWSHDVRQFRDEIGRFYANGRVRLVEQGPVRATIEVTAACGPSAIVQRISVYPETARVDVECEIDFREAHRMLKLCVPTRAADGVPTYEIPYSFMERQATGDEDPGQKWVDMAGTIDGRHAGVTVINDGRYGFDAKDGEIRTSVLRTAVYAFHARRQVAAKEEYHYTDLGRTSFRYALVPHVGGWRTVGAPRRAEEFNTPTVAFAEPFHNGAFPQAGAAFAEVGPENVAGMILKVAQRDGRLILRMYEAHGEDGVAKVSLPQHGIACEVSIGHHEIRTLAFDLARPDAPPVEVNLLEEPVR